MYHVLVNMDYTDLAVDILDVKLLVFETKSFHQLRNRTCIINLMIPQSIREIISERYVLFMGIQGK